MIISLPHTGKIKMFGGEKTNNAAIPSADVLTKD
jgi:hypothetical protein